MQVEVSKYTEGVNEKALRPNGLPKSLIRYDGKHDTLVLDMTLTSNLIPILYVSARQKEKALGSITEVVQTVKHPRSHIHPTSDDTAGKHEEEEKFNLDYFLPNSAEIETINTLGRQTPQFDSRSDVSLASSSQEAGKKSRKSGRTSLAG